MYFQDSIPFSIELCSDCIQDAYKNHHVSESLEEVVTSLSGVVDGSKYKENDYVAVEFTQAAILFGKIVMLFQHTQTSRVCFLVKKIEGEYNPDMGFYDLSKRAQPVYECVAFLALKSYSPLHSYNKDNKEVIVLKHALLSP